MPNPPASRRAKPAGIIDVAVLAGVSPATVSRALSGQGRVSAVTRQRVHQAARELSYVVSPHASGLASGRTRTIGLVVPFMTRWFFANAVAGAAEVFRDAGYDVLLHPLGNAVARDRFFERMPLTRRVDAVVTLALPLTDEHTRALRAVDMPLVTLGARLSGVSCVRIDDVAAARTAVHHLLDQGHEDIAMVCGQDDAELGFVSSRDRREGYRQAMAAARLQSRESLSVAGTYGIEGGAGAMAELMAGSRLPTAVLFEYDELAIGAMRTLRRAGVSIPGHLSVVGMDDHEMASVVDLTTVAQPVHQQGATAARLLLDIVDGRQTEPADVVLPTRLIVRSSTGDARTGP